ncbi:MAG TPA: Cof-type HAD-IIB family hydrolase [Bacillota bacterium]|nr:Cof-type HAD-IIB family hydrolase [Bacillota bacterium]
MKEWRLIALDLDGTLLNEHGLIAEENQRSIQQARSVGVEVTIATGRPIHQVKPIIELLGLTTPFVTTNGSEVWTVDGQLLDRHTIPSDTIWYLHKLAQEFKVEFWFSVANTVLQRGVLPKNVGDYQWLKFGYTILDQEVKKALWSRLENYGGLEISSSGTYNIEINPQGVSKASGLQVVCNYLGMTAGEVVTMGDGLNDVLMLSWSGFGIAMGNADEQVKEIANWVTSHHLEHGVAKAIRYLLLNESSLDKNQI